jgi:hypothetical protein
MDRRERCIPSSDRAVAVIEVTSDESVPSSKVALLRVDFGADFLSRSSALPSL